MPTHSLIHSLFDGLALIGALLSGFLVYRWKLKEILPNTTRTMKGGYLLALSFGSLFGSFFFGTLDLSLAHMPGIGRSILGSIVGATLMVELYKKKNNISGSTGYVYVVPFCMLVVIGRFGCFFSGLQDYTYGLPTLLPWGHDFGNGIPRHPVQLYESLSMAFFLIVALIALKKNPLLMIRYGYYCCVGFYGLQRFIWEFFKPYPQIFMGLNLFQFLCIFLIVYAVYFIYAEAHASDNKQPKP